MRSPNQRINVYLNDGGLGDRVATLPAILYCLRNYDHVSMDIWVPGYFVELARHALRGFEERAAVIDMARMAQLLEPLPSVVFHNSYHTTLRTHLVDRAFRILNDSDYVSDEAKSYPQLRLDEIDIVRFGLPEKYVVLTPGYTAAVRKLPAKQWNAIADWLAFKGVPCVWLGAKADTITGSLTPESKFEDEINYNWGIDLRDQTTLLEAGKVLSLATAVVGLDNGLLHLAGMTDVPIIAGFTSVDPATRLPYRRGIKGWNVRTVVPPATSCRFIQTKTHFNYSADFRECLCGTNDCVDALTSDAFIKILEGIL